MRKQKSGRIILLYLLFSVLVICSSAVQLSAADPTLNAEVKSSADGKTVTLTFTVENNPGIASYRFFVNYDTSILKPLVTSRSSKLSVGTYSDNIDSANGRLTVLWFHSKNFKADGELAVVTFSVVGEVKNGMYSIDAFYDPVDIINADLTTVEFKTKGVLKQQIPVQSKTTVPSSGINIVSGTVNSAQSNIISSSSIVQSSVQSKPTSASVHSTSNNYSSDNMSSSISSTYESSTPLTNQKSKTNVSENISSGSPSISAVTSFQMPDYIPASSEIPENILSSWAGTAGDVSNLAPEAVIPGAVKETDNESDSLTAIILVIAAVLILIFVVLLVKKKSNKQV